MHLPQKGMYPSQSMRRRQAYIDHADCAAPTADMCSPVANVAELESSSLISFLELSSVLAALTLAPKRATRARYSPQLEDPALQRRQDARSAFPVWPAYLQSHHPLSPAQGLDPVSPLRRPYTLVDLGRLQDLDHRPSCHWTSNDGASLGSTTHASPQAMLAWMSASLLWEG